MGFRYEVRTDPDWYQVLAEPWDALHQADPRATPFQSRAWLTAWVQTLGRNRRPHVASIWDGRELVALLPLQRRGHVFRRLQPMGTGVSDVLDTLRLPDLPDSALVRLAEGVSEAGVDLVDLPQQRRPLPAEWNSAAQAHSLVLDLPPTFETYRAGLPKNLRRDLAQGARRCEEGGFTLRVLDPSEHAQAFNAFLLLHRKRWGRRFQPGAFARPGVVAFHRRWLEQAGESACFYQLERNGEPVGSIYTLRTARTVSFYQAGISPDFPRLSIGSLLIAGAIEAAIASGRVEFDFLRGAEPYKRRWQPQRCLDHRRVWRVRPGAQAPWLDRALRAQLVVEDLVRAKLERWG